MFFSFTKVRSNEVNLPDLMSAIERVKDGLFNSSKYKSQSVTTGNRHFFVFANEFPVFKYLSKDRWVLYRIGPVSKKLYPLVRGEPEFNAYVLIRIIVII